jgi:Tol biopolymer transport system component
MRSAHRLPAAALIVGLMVAALAFTPARALASFPGANGRIAFDDFVTNQIYAINPDGSGLAQLTHEPSDRVAFLPSWSPDGSRVLFTVNNLSTGVPSIWMMDADGAHQHQVASDAPGYRDYQPLFTSTGHIVFSRCKPNNGVCAIWIMRVDGTDKQPITPFKEGSREAVDFDPSVSPDGHRVAYTAFGQNGITAQVRVVRVDGTGNHAVSPPAVEAGHPGWSPDGTRITFTSNRPGIHSNVYTMAADGSDITRLTHTAYPNNSFASVYSPDGGQIAYSSDRRYPDLCCVDLFVMNADGSHQHLVHTGLQGILDVAWGPAPPVRPRAGGG